MSHSSSAESDVEIVIPIVFHHGQARVLESQVDPYQPFPPEHDASLVEQMGRLVLMDLQSLVAHLAEEISAGRFHPLEASPVTLKLTARLDAHGLDLRDLSARDKARACALDLPDDYIQLTALRMAQEDD